MNISERLEWTLRDALNRSDDPGCPPTLRTALTYAVYPGGHRIRPKLSLAVAQACGLECPEISLAAAASIEFLHCASLVHDDLPAFDNADIRRGKPSLHKAFGEQVALLAGDALIVLAFETLAIESASKPDTLAQLIKIIAASVGAPRGIVAGQAWESEQRINLANYHQEKTGSLFAAATMSGAVSCGYDAEEWRHLGITVGESYQIADDIRDVCASAEEIGKPTGQDEANSRPNIAQEMGVDDAVLLLKRMIAEAVEKIPQCPGRNDLQKQITTEGQHFLPENMRDVA